MRILATVLAAVVFVAGLVMWLATDPNHVTALDVVHNAGVHGGPR